MLINFFKKWYALIGVAQLFLSFFPEDLLIVPRKLRVLFFISGFIIIIFWVIFSKVYFYLVEKFQYIRIRMKRVRVGVYIDNLDLTRDVVDYCNKEINSNNLSNKIIFEVYEVKENKLAKIHKKVANSNLDLVVWVSENKAKKIKCQLILYIKILKII